jgi:hypothetical protein
VCLYVGLYSISHWVRNVCVQHIHTVHGGEREALATLGSGMGGGEALRVPREYPADARGNSRSSMFFEPPDIFDCERYSKRNGTLVK